ncbi:LacI family DNA-binding transcriptional regulator [Microbacterium marinilacus]|uniref:LacI family DNA-binding transcriptional regulator n=1 Tax=Microbacterium marinilacus TaxID=415209 RepID=A0ABP7BPL4_9MICO|nr:LacI family DNA-binding transcriptional regulator [Microbacterium marinilacus]MBY0690396.1 LacI family transcriptional regulator [Microbacterium marinilacus]
MNRRVRLADVAELVGVSPKTVSNVVNDTGAVSDAMKARVRDAIDQLGYRPNLAARELRSGSTRLIALAVPGLAEPYFAEFAASVVEAARRRDATVLVTQSRGNRAHELSIIEGEGFPALGGIVLSPLALTADDIASRRSRVPLVLIGEHGESLATDDVTHVGPDNEAAARTATEFLLAQGRRDIAVIGLQDRLADTARVRFDGYRSALVAAGLAPDERLQVEVSGYNRAEGSRAIERLLARDTPFDGVFCFNDSLAFGAMHTLARHGIAVPDDVSVVGFDNIEESRYTVPPLPTIDTGVARSSDRIVEMLLDPSGPRGGHIEAPYSLHVGDEVLPTPA